MKIKIIYYISTALALFSLLSCEDALDRYPKDRLTPEVFFSNREECEMYTNNYYPIFPGGSDIYGERDDIIVRNTLQDELTNNRVIPATGGGWSWSDLRKINFFLQHSSNCKDEDVRLEYEGLSRFFRAYFYFDKIRRFGDVPWVDRPLDAGDPELYKPRDSREFVMQKVIEDIDFAIKYLPNKSDIYRVTGWTALALKSRICLFEGTFRKYHGLDDYEKYLELCAAASEELMTKGPYSIYTAGEKPYQDLFTSQKAISTEIILARAYNTSIGLKHDVNGYLTSPTMGTPGMMRNIANMYLLTDGKPFTSQAGWEDLDFVDQCKNRDLRMSQTLRTPGYTRIGSTEVLAPNFSQTSTGYQLIKYLTESKYDSYQASMNDLPLFRLAEVYLNFAEAKAELGTITQSDIDKSIKPLRDRAGVANLDLAEANANPDPYLASDVTGYRNVTGTNKGVILEIRRERTLELVMEGHRYWDIMRWKEGKRFEQPFEGLYFDGEGVYDIDGDGKNDLCIYTSEKAPSLGSMVYLKLGTEVILTNETSGHVLLFGNIKRNWNEGRDYLYPIPTEDRIVTQGAITQNPGWNDGISFD